MKNLMISGSLVALLLAAPAAAQPARAPLTRATVAANVQENFARADRDRDGYVSKAEAEAGREERRSNRAGQRQERRGDRFARLDVNGDGSITRQEFENRARAQGDRAQRRSLRAERRAERAERRAERRSVRGIGFGQRAFERLDTNRDGRISLAEATAARLQRFDRVDANRDGVVSQEERRAVRQNRRG